MSSRRRTAGWLTATLALVVPSIGCIDRPVHVVNSNSQSGLQLHIVNDQLTKLDLLLEIDNSNSMRENQTHMMAQLGSLIARLTSPPCVSDTNPSPHTCNAGDTNDRLQYPAVRDMHVAVISSDLGSGGIATQTCANPDHGDDGAMNPIRSGDALAAHEPWVNAPGGFRPASCTSDRNAFPAFLSFDSATSDAATFAEQFACNAGLYIGGCAMEQQLEAVTRSLVFHNPHEGAPSSEINAGFLREDALLAIVMLTDEEDGSVRDCRFANGEPCESAIDVYNAASTAWGSTNLNLRMYAYQPGSAQDPTWPLDRYIDPHDATRGWLALKPGHPERVVFAAITGVPLSVPANAAGETDWDRLLGTPGGDPNDFDARDTSTSIDETSAEGPISMRQNNVEAACATTLPRVVPACRREGTPQANSCDPTQQYYAWPSRRIVEIARRFDQAPLCGGQPCHNGVVTSICANDYSAAMDTILKKIRDRFAPPCLPRPLQSHITAGQTREVECALREIQPIGVESCDASRGRFAPTDGAASETLPDGQHLVCDIRQVGTDLSTGSPTAGHGWFYQDHASGSSDPACAQRISFTDGDAPVVGTDTRLECVQATTIAP